MHRFSQLHSIAAGTRWLSRPEGYQVPLLRRLLLWGKQPPHYSIGGWENGQAACYNKPLEK
jgi:hypothetical protein